MKSISLKNMTQAQLKDRLHELNTKYDALQSQIYAAREASDAHSNVTSSAIREMNALNATLLKIAQTVRMGGEPEQPFTVVFDQHQGLFERYEQLADVQAQHYRKLQALYDRTESIGRKIDNVRKLLQAHERHPKVNENQQGIDGDAPGFGG